ncbi:magnesium transporter [Oikeobacillus pervagus]|uniref:Magnesium transport protein CorA n=1 Tax=Oikeobacillus pervagus TaxID=1325931 RepID=A0AAJ1SYG7_9BACI|nr:magnesium/cobalt transporter CorA [Oikeobacillus pervagus]MDQ0214829.1 magnesium transporter [Oikeobacillus pervagus]
MIRTCVLKKDGEVMYNVPLQDVKKTDVSWYWVDFSDTTRKEEKLLGHFFRFHPLAIEDCLDSRSERPKVDFYDTYFFFLVHAINQATLEAYEVDIFISDQFIVTFHKQQVRALNNLWDQIQKDDILKEGPFLVLHSIVDKLVDDYFPPVYRIEDQLNQIEDNTEDESINELMDKIFDIRHDMSKLRRSFIPMRDLLYRMLNSVRLESVHKHKLYFHDIYDHLIKLVEMLESYREFSSDIRDNYLSISSNRMNTTMMTLTVITTIFMPLTFIVGIYGMNFDHMPELHFKYGYFFILGIMSLIALIMVTIFMKVGWLRLGKKKLKGKRKIQLK